MPKPRKKIPFGTPIHVFKKVYEGPERRGRRQIPDRRKESYRPLTTKDTNRWKKEYGMTPELLQKWLDRARRDRFVHFFAYSANKDSDWKQTVKISIQFHPQKNTFTYKTVRRIISTGAIPRKGELDRRESEKNTRIERAR